MLASSPRLEPGLLDFYTLDSLACDSTAPITIVCRIPRSRRRPDSAGQDAAATWSLLEAKARAVTGQLDRVRREALAQVRAVDLRTSRRASFPNSTVFALPSGRRRRPRSLVAGPAPPTEAQPSPYSSARALGVAMRTGPMFGME